MKLNAKHRTEMTEKIVKKAMTQAFADHNAEVRNLAKTVMGRRFAPETEPYERKLTKDEQQRGFEHRLEYSVCVAPEDQNAPHYEGVYLAPLGFFIESRNDKILLVGDDMNTRSWNRSPAGHRWEAKLPVVIPQMQRMAVIELRHDEYVRAVIGENEANRTVDAVLYLHMHGEVLVQKTRDLMATTRDALASCNTDRQVREMLPSAVEFLPPEPAKSLVPVEQLRTANQAIKKALTQGEKK